MNARSETVEDRAEPIAVGLVRAEQPEVVGIPTIDLGDHLAQPAGRLDRRAGSGQLYGVVTEVGQIQVVGQQASIGVRRGAHPKIPNRVGRIDQRSRNTGRVEQFLRSVGLQPLLQHRQMFRIVAYAGQRHLMGTPAS